MPPPQGFPPYQYNREARAYVDSRGVTIPTQTVWQVADEVTNNLSQEMRAITESLQAGRLTLPEWQLQMEQRIKDSHLAFFSASRGGWEQMTFSDFGRAGNMIKKQYGYLRRWAEELSQGLPLDGRQLVRAELYGQAARTVLVEIEREEQALRGRTQKRNVLGVADHCDECIAMTELGWVDIEAGAEQGFTPIGQRICLVRCKCFMEYQ